LKILHIHRNNEDFEKGIVLSKDNADFHCQCFFREAFAGPDPRHPSPYANGIISSIEFCLAKEIDDTWKGPRHVR
jgi:hypothetical protein